MLNRINTFGTYVTATNQPEANRYFLEFNYSRKGYVCFPNTYVITKANKDSQLQNILNQSAQTLPDGKPLEYYARAKGEKMSTVSGYWLCKSLLESNLSHYFYGASTETIAILEKKLKEEYPEARILGYQSPPMVSVEETKNHREIEKDMERIRLLAPDIVWIGMSSPKQDFLMHHWHQKLDHGVMMGVGAVFSYLAGTEKKSPEWMKQMGLRWVYRIMQDPRKHFVKYMVSNTKFLMLYLKEIISSKR
jgi:N-acetylglucosaminyldiphosphoundecaprenol N-acetyl-beta-D-mannosaminyltransferase